jgi:hypothetical protein
MLWKDDSKNPTDFIAQRRKVNLQRQLHGTLEIIEPLHRIFPH